MAKTSNEDIKTMVQYANIGSQAHATNTSPKGSPFHEHDKLIALAEATLRWKMLSRQWLDADAKGEDEDRHRIGDKKDETILEMNSLADAINAERKEQGR